MDLEVVKVGKREINDQWNVADFMNDFKIISIAEERKEVPQKPNTHKRPDRLPESFRLGLRCRSVSTLSLYFISKMFGPLGPSLAPYVRQSRTLSKWIKPLATWYADLAGYRKMGLKYDDLRASRPLHLTASSWLTTRPIF